VSIGPERFKNDDLEAALLHAAERSSVPLSLAAMATAPDSCRSCRPTTRASPNSARSPVSVCWWRCGEHHGAPCAVEDAQPPGEKEPVGYAFLAPVDHSWKSIVSRLSSARCGRGGRHAGAVFPPIRFQPDPSEERQVESIATYLDLRKDPNTAQAPST